MTGDERSGAGLLREAARLMREQAERATPGPWYADTPLRVARAYLAAPVSAGGVDK